jgi:hypothetical protein
LLTVTSVVRKGVAWAAIPAVAGLMLAAFGSVSPAAQAARTPAPGVSPGLKIARTIKLAKASTVGTFAEAPNGAVYYTVGTRVFVVNGNSRPVVATALATPIIALAVNSTDFFVQTGLTVFEYSRHTDAYAGHQWNLSSPHKPITSAGLLAVGNTVWSWTDWANDNSGFQFATVSRISTSSAHAKVVSKSNVYPGDVAADSAGLYYQTINRHLTNGYIVRSSPSGSTRRHVDVNIGVPMALAAGRVDLLAKHSNGHTYVDSYRATTLARLGSKRVFASDQDIAGTSAGLLVLREPCASFICIHATVSVLSPVTGKVSGTVRVAHAGLLLPGPAPVVITDVSGELYLVRLRG